MFSFICDYSHEIGAKTKRGLHQAWCSPLIVGLVVQTVRTRVSALRAARITLAGITAAL